jgi:hypothetical protein
LELHDVIGRPGRGQGLRLARAHPLQERNAVDENHREEGALCVHKELVYQSDASNIVANDTNGKSDVFLRIVRTP